MSFFNSLMSLSLFQNIIQLFHAPLLSVMCRARYNSHPRYCLPLLRGTGVRFPMIQIQHLSPISPFSICIPLPPASCSIYISILFQSLWCFLFPRWLQLTLLGKSFPFLSRNASVLVSVPYLASWWKEEGNSSSSRKPQLRCISQAFWVQGLTFSLHIYSR